MFNQNNTFIINLDKRQDRLKYCAKQLSTVNIKFTRYPAICPDMTKISEDPIWKDSYQEINPQKTKKYKHYLKGSLGCKISHYNVIKKAKDANLDYVIIFEDDIIIKDDMKHIFNINLISKLPHNWDILYFGGDIIGKQKHKVDTNIFKVDGVIYTLGYVLHSRAYDKIMKAFIHNKTECDNIYVNLGKNKIINVYKIEPDVVYQTWNNSDIVSGYVSKKYR